MSSIILTCCGETISVSAGDCTGAIDCPACGKPFTEADIEELQFAQAPMLRRLFEEPTSEIEREDPWSGPKGFMIGGMALPTQGEMGRQYFEAAGLLVEAVKRGDIEDYRVANPVLFLYRHSIEMTLKGIMHSVPKTHDLARLADDFDALIEAKCGQPAPGWITARLKEIASVDPTSTVFRYGRYYCKKTKQDLFVEGETYIDLYHLQRVMKTLLAALNNVFEVASRHNP